MTNWFKMTMAHTGGTAWINRDLVAAVYDFKGRTHVCFGGADDSDILVGESMSDLVAMGFLPDRESDA